MAVFNSLGALNVARNDARQTYHQAMYDFDKKPSTSNWNKLIDAMRLHTNLQYNVIEYLDYQPPKPTGKYYTSKSFN